MNATELTAETPETEVIESTDSLAVDEPQKISMNASRHARLRYALLIVAAAFLAWLAFTINNATREVESDLDKAYASMVTESK